jgi:FkbM family methyltransferase
MTSPQELQALHQNGRIEEARAVATQAMKSGEGDARQAGALYVVHNLHYDLFTVALAALNSLRSQFENDIDYCNAVAYASWVNNDIELCRWASKRCISLNPVVANGYVRLGLAELGRQQYVEALCALSAGLFHCPADPQLRHWYPLARRLAQGTRQVRFVFDAIEFVFALSVFNTQAIEMALHHVHARLYEPEELRHARQFVGTCDSVVEMGALVGNHTIYFAKALRPKRIHVFDANPIAVAQVRENVALNGLNDGVTEIIVRHAAVGGKAGSIQMFDQEVPLVRLDDEVKDKVDFIKIDVDGMELEVLEGCRALISRDRPKIMIEVQRELKPRFLKFLQGQAYRIEHEISRATDSNCFVSPV